MKDFNYEEDFFLCQLKHANTDRATSRSKTGVTDLFELLQGNLFIRTATLCCLIQTSRTNDCNFRSISRTIFFILWLGLQLILRCDIY